MQNTNFKLNSMANIIFLLLLCCLLLISCGGISNGGEECGSNASCAPDSNLFGTAWSLRQYTSASGQIEPVAEQTKYQILLEPNTTNLEVFIGCVNYSDSAYEANDGHIILKLGTRDGVECNTDATEFMDQNSAIMSLLEGGDFGSSVPLMFVTGYGTLTLTAHDGRVLEFEEVSQLMQQQ